MHHSYLSFYPFFVSFIIGNHSFSNFLSYVERISSLVHSFEHCCERQSFKPLLHILPTLVLLAMVAVFSKSCLFPNFTALDCVPDSESSVREKTRYLSDYLCLYLCLIFTISLTLIRTKITYQLYRKYVLDRLPRECEKVTIGLRLDGGFRRVLFFPLPLITDLSRLIAAVTLNNGIPKCKLVYKALDSSKRFMPLTKNGFDS